MKESRSRPVEFSRQDVAEIAIGCCIMAFPVATAEEIWTLGETLSTVRALLLAVASIFFLALLMYQLHHSTVAGSDRRDFALRVVSTYGLTLVISALILFSIDRLDLFDEPQVALKRVILVAFPASFAATTVDSLNRSQP